MKYFKTTLFLTLVSFSCMAQEIIVPLNDFKYLDEDFLEENQENVYVKDVNGLLTKFIGVWKGSADGIDYEFKIDKGVDNRLNYDFKIDVLFLRYLIKDASGKVFGNIISVADDNDFIIYGSNYNEDNDVYVLVYSEGGGDPNCGQTGDVLIHTTDTTNNFMKLVMIPDRIFLSENECPDGRAEDILPTTSVTLTRQ